MRECECGGPVTRQDVLEGLRRALHGAEVLREQNIEFGWSHHHYDEQIAHYRAEIQKRERGDDV